MVARTMIPLAELHLHQALALIDRWSKLRDCWYYADLEKLHLLEEQLIPAWAKAKALVARRVIHAESPVLAAMQAELKLNGARLRLLNEGDWQQALDQAEGIDHYKTLSHLVQGKLQVPLSAAVQAQFQADYQAQLADYKRQMQTYEAAQRQCDAAWSKIQAEIQTYLPKVRTQLRAILTLETAKQQAKTQGKKRKQPTRPDPAPDPASDPAFDLGRIKQTLEWANGDAISRKQASKIVAVLKAHLQPADLDRSFPQAPPQPIRPTPPILHRKVQASNYSPGSLPAVEAALDWARSVLQRPQLQAAEVDEELIGDKLARLLEATAMDHLVDQALELFAQIVRGRLTDPKAIYDQLTRLPLDYSAALGLEPERQPQKPAQHRAFGRWHEVYLAPAGLWLVEFWSTVDPAICFYLPYDRAIEAGLGVERLPVEEAKQFPKSKEMTAQEQQAYPIEDLVQLFGKRPDNFPHRLKHPSGLDRG